ncbi:actin [Trichophyton tonsurans CBS 112818]|uniref:Centractin n=1 Tax=Trichophyton tonsurans (strain CBS 112818) TaxID=647933 RepID=F2RU31_TRIT1|nr:actin [Trichophyton tonsurans CBS 112818]
MADTALHNAPIVLDNGSGTIRAGFAGEDLPKCYFPSFVGRPKHPRVLAGALEGDVFIGQRAQELRGLLKIRYPLEHGIVTDWDDMEKIWQWVYEGGIEDLLLRKSGYVFHTSAEKEVVRMIKEKTGYVAMDPRKEEKEWSTNGGKADSKRAEYVLPDGHKLKIGVERFRAPEILFDPEIIGLEYPGVHQIVVDAINRTDMDLRKSLFANIVLSGGSTLCKGFGDRLLHEVQRLAVKDMRIKIFAPPERKYSTWIGGSILAGLSTFRKMWVSIDDWHENPDIIHTKFT